MKRLFVVGTGPGDPKFLTEEARKAIAQSEFVAGFPLYLDLIRDLLEGKETFTAPMGKELERCRAALEAAQAGKTAALVCSGDAGIYGLAGLALELAPEYGGVEVELIPGLTAALSCAALLGSPLTNDFAVVSLSDLLTPWDLIEKRLSGAAAAGFVLCLYNPGSRGRKGHLERACGIVLRHRDARSVCGVVRNAGREGQSLLVTTLGELRSITADMFTTIFIGNEATKNIGGKMVTSRGYAWAGHCTPPVNRRVKNEG
ncbi:MAG: precorrin-3B C(17)-methyltransferase [Treponema sp.]|jgi:precorrin-3B C17-methyltransferase|nr:precorrin-3B C(17)-methyltransferase [Treponema sp.]